MTTELQFSLIKGKLNDMVNDELQTFFEDKVYDPKEASKWPEKISNEIITKLSNQKRGFKFICSCTILQKGDAPLHFSSTCKWNPNTDGSISVKYDTDQVHCFVCLFGFAP